MIIQCIRTHHLECPVEQPFGFSQWYYDKRNTLLVEVIADTGETGWGECYGPASVNQAAVSGFYAPLLIGRDALQTDMLWHSMWQASLDFARGGIMMAAMSGLDMALWDLKGKALGLSVSQMMGGAYVDRVEGYATGMYFSKRPERELIDALVAEAAGHADQGFKAMKIKVGKNPAFDKQLIREMRKALPETALMADANHAYDLPEAVDVGRELDRYHYRWFEEPLSPEHPELFRQLQDKLALPLATGESEQTRYGFERLLAPGGVGIVQPDLAYCGGPSEAIRIRAVASAKGVNVIPHVWGTMLSMAAATHFLASTYREPGRAEVGGRILECDRTPNLLRDELFRKPLAIEAGAVRVPPAPGLGVEVDESKIPSFEIKGTETK